jgi:hypothetical protein
MMASRLVKSCLFMLVALAPVAAKASFVIDTFNGSQGSSYTLANGLGVDRLLNPISGGSLNLVSNATGTSFNYSYSVNNMFVPQIATTSIGYRFDQLVSAVDTLGGTPALQLKFNSVTGSGWFVQAEWFSDTAFTNSIGTGGTSMSASGSTSFVNFAATGLTAARSLLLTFTTVSATASSGFNLSNVTATPEPTTLLMFSAVAGAGFVARRRMKKKVA